MLYIFKLGNMQHILIHYNNIQRSRDPEVDCVIAQIMLLGWKASFGDLQGRTPLGTGHDVLLLEASLDSFFGLGPWQGIHMCRILMLLRFLSVSM